MNLVERIDADLMAAMRARDEMRTSVLRMLKSAVRYAAIEQHGAEANPTDAEVMAVVRRQVKQREDAVAGFEQGGRSGQAEAERLEMAILREYLPRPLEAEELVGLVAAAIEDAGGRSVAQMGPVMKLASARAEGRADGKVLSEEVRRQLSGGTGG